MKFNVSFGAKNIFTLDITPVTNRDWWYKLLEDNRPVSEVDHHNAMENPYGDHSFGTLTRAREIAGDGAYVTFAV